MQRRTMPWQPPPVKPSSMQPLMQLEGLCMQYPLMALLSSQPFAGSGGPAGANDMDGASTRAPSEQGQPRC